MVRVWFLMTVLTALLAACTVQEPQASVTEWKTMIGTRESSQSSAGTGPENEKESASDCLRKNSVIDAWSCASKE